MTDREFDERVYELRERVARIQREQEQQNPFLTSSGMGDKVSGIQVIGPDGTIKKEWHDE